MREQDLCDPETRFVADVVANGVSSVNLPTWYMPDPTIRQQLANLGFQVANKPYATSMTEICQQLEKIQAQAQKSALLLLKVALLNEEDPNTLDNINSPSFASELKKFHCVWLVRTGEQVIDSLKTEKIKRRLLELGLMVSSHSYVCGDLDYLVKNIAKCEVNKHIPYMFSCFYLTDKKLAVSVRENLVRSIVIGSENVDEAIKEQTEQYRVAAQHAKKIVDSLQAEIARLQEKYAQKNNGEIARRINRMARSIDVITRNVEFGTLTFKMLSDELEILANGINHADWMPYIAQYMPGLSWFVPKPQSAHLLETIKEETISSSRPSEDDINEKSFSRSK
jgi:hypothetical protein